MADSSNPLFFKEVSIHLNMCRIKNKPLFLKENPNSKRYDKHPNSDDTRPGANTKNFKEGISN